MRSIQAEPLRRSLWLVHLFLRPREFFRTWVDESAPDLTILSAWIVGMSAFIDRFEQRAMLANIGGGSPVSLAWPLYGLLVPLGGIVSGGLAYWIGAWWYRVRLRWSGASSPARNLGRRVYLYSGLVWAIPSVLYAVSTTFVYTDPVAAALGDDWLAAVLMPLLFWSVYVSYRGVRTAFVVKRWPARIWFFVLPQVLYLVILAGAVIAMFAGALEAPPDLSQVQRIERAHFRLDHPGNWSVDVNDEDHDPDRNFVIGPELADAIQRFWFYPEPMDSQECVDATRENVETKLEVIRLEPISRWGRYDGAGYLGTGTIDGTTVEVLLFCSTDRNQPFETLRVVDADLEERLAPGFELIEETFLLLEPEPGPVDPRMPGRAALPRRVRGAAAWS